MPISIGFRVEPSCFHWAVLDGSVEEPVLVADGRAGAPKTYSEPQALSWYRDRVLMLVSQHRPELAAVKFIEPIARVRGTAVHARCRIEGVVLEALNREGLRIVAGAYATLSAQLDSRSAKAYLDGAELRGIDWGSRPGARREAILTACAALGE